MTRILLTPFIICLLIMSCSSGKKALERGDYFTSTLQAVNRLRSNPNSSKALDAVKESYPMSMTYFSGKIENALGSNTPFKYSEVVDYYEKMNLLSDEVSRCPAAIKILPKVDYFTKELAQARKLAA